MVLIAACSSPAGPSDGWQEELDAAESKWAAAGPSDYDYHYRVVCGECLPSAMNERLIMVRNGEVQSVRDLVADTLYTSDVTSYRIVDQFERVQGYVDIPAARLTVEYNPTLGYPASVSVDPVEGMVDDEHSFMLWGLVAVP
jgi:hypothetical protein